MTLWTLIKSGGLIMVPLFVCSVATIIVFVERYLAYKGWEEKNEQFILSFSNHVIKGEWDQAKKTIEKANVDVAELAQLLVEGKESAKSQDVITAKIDRKRLQLNSELKKFLWLLGTIGSSAPFIGLFGTVVGIIESFNNMAVTGAGGFSVVAAGISQALVATAGGIIVAVVSVFFFNFFQVRVAKIQFQLKLYTEELLELYGHQTK